MGRIAHPDPEELVLLDQRIAAHARAVGNVALPRDRDAPCRCRRRWRPDKRKFGAWHKRAIAYVETLPAKKPQKPKAKPKRG